MNRDLRNEKDLKTTCMYMYKLNDECVYRGIVISPYLPTFHSDIQRRAVEFVLGPTVFPLFSISHFHFHFFSFFLIYFPFLFPMPFFLLGGGGGGGDERSLI